MPTADGLREAYVTIAGHVLSFAEVMSLRVAVSSMRISLSDPEFRKGCGESLATNYDTHLASVERMLIEGSR